MTYDVRAVQERLAALGYAPGPIDGLWGPKTSAAVRAFQIAEHLTPTGEVDGATEFALRPATRPMIYQGRARYPVREIVLHTSATPTGWADGKTVSQMRAEIRRWHKEKGWRDIGYHYVAAPDGSVAVGRQVQEIGAHVIGNNRGTIGVCMIPAREVTGIGKPEDFYEPVQISAVRRIIQHLAAATQIEKVSGHNEYANKLCPGFRVRQGEWL